MEAGSVRFFAVFLIVCFLSALSGEVSASTQRFIVEYRNNSSGSVDEDFQHLGTQPKKSIANRNLVAVELNSEMLNALRFSPNVVSIENDHRRYPLAQTQPYGVNLVQALQLSADTPRKVCIIDSGYELGHPDLPNNETMSRVTGESQIEGEAWDAPGDSHGTHVAGTIAAIDNSDGVIGVYHDSGLTLHIVKVFDDQGSWTYSSDLIAAVDSCVNAGAHVINMSLGGSGSSTSEAEVFAEALADNVLSIAAAGNSGGTNLSYPASYDSVMSVAAVDESEELATFSTRNEQVEIAAPGVGVLSTVTGGSYASYSGTSMATPHVAAGAAMLWSNHDSCTAEEIRHALNKAAKDLGPAGRDNSYGHGLLQIKSAHDAFVEAGGCDVGPIIPPEVYEAIRVEDLSASSGEQSLHSFEIPADASNLSVEIGGGSGDADLYLKQGSPPTLTDYDCRSWDWYNEETCSVSEPTAGSYYVMLHAYSAYSGVTLVASYTQGGGGGTAGKLPVVVESVGAKSHIQDRLIDELADNSQKLATSWNNNGSN
ncbi:MAG: S8 family serine peptidase, partial [Pseudomonadales bacterium]|nr:S8 family serine peptidase [Pseudomonadales bacterium]